MKAMIFLLSICAIVSCTRLPEPLVAGRDVCVFCSMTIADTRFGGEIITPKQKIFKFDDLGCLIKFRKENFSGENSGIENFTACYTNPKKVFRVNGAFFLLSEKLRSPMGSGAAAFQNKEDANGAKQEFGGEIFSWNELEQKIN